jgi:ribosomal protein L29
MTDEQLKEKLSACVLEMALERGQIKTGGRTSNPGKISELRHTISRIRTILHERKIGIAHVAVEKKKSSKTGEQKASAPSNVQKQAEKASTPSNAQEKTAGASPAAKTPVEQKPQAENVPSQAKSAIPSNEQTQPGVSPAASQKTVEAKPPEKR